MGATAVEEPTRTWQTTEERAPELWQPGVPGDCLVGTFVGLDEIKMDNPADNFTYLLIRDEAGVLWSLSYSYKLRQGFEGKITPGEIVRIEFHGKRDLNNGKAAMNNYSVAVAR